VSHPGNGAYYYWYRVRAEAKIGTGSLGFSGYSSQDAIHLVVTPGMPATISPTLDTSTTGIFTISWGLYTGSVVASKVFYEMYQGMDSTFSTQVLMYTGTLRSQSVNTHALGDFYFRVRACNQDGSVKVCSDYKQRAHEIVTGTGGGGGQQQQIQAPVGGGGVDILAPPSGTIGMAMPALIPLNEDQPKPLLAVSRHSGEGRNPVQAKAASIRPKFAPPIYKAWAAAHLANATGGGTTVRFSVKHVYSGNGYLSKITSGVDVNRIYWQVDSSQTGILTGEQRREHGIDAYGQVMDAIAGSGSLATHYGYDGTTGYLDSIKSTNGTTTYQDLKYTWKAIGNLVERSSNADAVNGNALDEIFSYDLHNRLVKSTVTDASGSHDVTQTYDSVGDILTKSDVGSYAYGSGAGPHAVTSIAGTVTGGYTYDAKGNMTCRSYTGACSAPNIAWNSDDLVTSITQGGSTSAFSYAPDKHRYKQTATTATGTETTLYAGGMEAVTDASGATQYRVTVSAYGRPVMIDTLTNGTTPPQGCSVTNNPTGKPVDCHFFTLTDHLGSVDTVVGDTGSVSPQESFEPFGKRRDSASWHGAPAAINVAQARTVTHRGFTHHEHLDNLTVTDGGGNTIDGVVDANGRMLDPVAGRFLSVDPVYQSPNNAQSINPYSYVMNNPLSLVDPSGYCASAADNENSANPTVCGKGDNDAGESDYQGHNNTRSMDHLAGTKMATFDKALDKALALVGASKGILEQHYGPGDFTVSWKGKEAVVVKINASSGVNNEADTSSTADANLLGPPGKTVRILGTRTDLTRAAASPAQIAYSDNEKEVQYADGTPITNQNTGTPLMEPAHVSLKANMSLGHMLSGVNPIIKAEIMKQWFRSSGVMDYQRFQGAFFSQYKDFTNYNFGAVMRASGYSESQEISSALIYNRVAGRTRQGLLGAPPSDWIEWLKSSNDYDQGKLNYK
jgi:RHS repeat-associated protein